MPVLPKDDMEGVSTRSQRQQERDEGRFGSPILEPRQAPQSVIAAATSSGALPPAMVQVTTSGDFAALMAMLQEQARRQEEQARRQEEQTLRLQQQLRQDKEEQTRRQEELARRQEEQAFRLQQQLRQDKEEQVRRQEEQTCLLKDLLNSFGKELQDVKEQVKHHESRLSEAETQIADVRKALNVIKSGDGNGISVAPTSSVRGFKVPPFDGSSSWSAYKIQFEAVVKSNGWTDAQAMTGLTLALRGEALTILEALGNNVNYEQLLEALESRYGDAHLEHIFRAQLKDRNQRSSENLQQWALAIEKLVRKAYQTSPALIDGNMVQAFVDGIRDLEVRAAVRLGHHESLKNALAHALEVEAARQQPRTERIREVMDSPRRREDQPRFSPRCFGSGENGYLRVNGPRDKESCIGKGTLLDNREDVAYVRRCKEWTGGNETIGSNSVSSLLGKCRKDFSKGEVAMTEKMETSYDRRSNNWGFDKGSRVWLHHPVRKKESLNETGHTVL